MFPKAQSPWRWIAVAKRGGYRIRALKARQSPNYSVSVVYEMSGLRNAPIVRFRSRSRGIGDGSNEMAARPKEEEAFGCLGARREAEAVGAGRV